MGFKKGVVTNPGGRPNGIKEKTPRKLCTDVIATLEMLGHDPLIALVRLAQSGDEKVSLKANEIILSRYAPLLKSIEHKRDEKQHTEMLEQLKASMSVLLDKHKKDY